MNYRCPKCSTRLSVGKLFFSDISTCGNCGERVVLGDFFAFFMAAMSMIVIALSSVYLLAHELNELDEPYTAGGLGLAIGMASAIAVVLLLGRAQSTNRQSRRAPSAQT
jgi:DNA-directed RNA polymerase subunit RPC12/RpoP